MADWKSYLIGLPPRHETNTVRRFRVLISGIFWKARRPAARAAIYRAAFFDTLAACGGLEIFDNTLQADRQVTDRLSAAAWPHKEHAFRCCFFALLLLVARTDHMAQAGTQHADVDDQYLSSRQAIRWMHAW
jgi:hypothetical protein